MVMNIDMLFQKREMGFQGTRVMKTAYFFKGDIIIQMFIFFKKILIHIFNLNYKIIVNMM